MRKTGTEAECKVVASGRAAPTSGGGAQLLCYSAPVPASTATATPDRRVLRLAVPAPLRKTFDYLPPAPGADGGAALQPGHALRVPFGRREVTAVLLALADNAAYPTDELREALRLVDEQPVLPPTLVDLLCWAADYYQHPVGEVFSAALPAALRSGKGLPLDAWRLTLRGRGLAEGALRRAPSQARVIDLLRQREHRHEELREAGISTAVLRELSNKTLIERCRREGVVPPAGLREPPPTLADEQAEVVGAIDGCPGFACHLLEGITGSGKTEVYLQLIGRCLERGRQALVLIPEIGLTPQTVARFASRFTSPVATLHSGLADGERLAAWQAARSGSAGIVIGTRSAILTPLARPGLVIIDEEHDGSYRQQDGFRYSARDLAVKRAQLEDTPVVLGSATPSLESLDNARRGRYHHHRLRGRRAGGVLPELSTIDLRGLTLQAGVSEALLAAIRDTVTVARRQVLLFLNRRGYAPTLQCHGCGWVAGCRHCDARLTVHLRQRSLRCHHCGARQALPDRCSDCGGVELLTRGLGTEQTEETLAALLPCPVHRVDSDAVRGREAMQALLDIARDGEPCVYIGTQMLTKGHHFPAVQLVGIIDADALLFSADFRGEERMAQLITQVAGRAGREDSGGRVLLQTHYPDSELFRELRTESYGAAARRMLGERHTAGLPPAAQLVMLRADAPAERDAEAFLTQLRRRLAPLPEGCELIGPLPSSMPRRAGRFRWQLWCISRDRRAMQQALRALVASGEGLKRPRQLNWFVDVDPVDVA